jgi:hypothetical protein
MRGTPIALLGGAAALAAGAVALACRGGRRADETAHHETEPTESAPGDGPPRLRVVEHSPAVARPAPEPACTPEQLELADGLSDEVLERAAVLFELLEREGAADATAVAEALGVSPRALPGLLLTPLRRRVDALGAPMPFQSGRNETTGGRRWQASGADARGMRHAVEATRRARTRSA